MIAAFDIGIKNFAFTIKEEDKFILLNNTSLTGNYTPSELSQYKKGELYQLLTCLNISSEEKVKKKDLINMILEQNTKMVKVDLGLNLFQIMDEYKGFWDKCEVFLIERQITTNLQALKLSHYLEAYLKIYYPTKIIVNYSASMKTKTLGACHLKTKLDRKKWTIQYVSQKLTGEPLKYFQSLVKKDDVADTICMIESYLLNKKNKEDNKVKRKVYK